MALKLAVTDSVENRITSDGKGKEMRGFFHARYKFEKNAKKFFHVRIDLYVT